MTFAEQLCHDLHSIRGVLEGSDASRPLVFLAHGIGGLVIKRALVDNADILRCTRHVIFFDTPHRGFDMQTWKAVTGRTMTDEAKDQFRFNSASLSELDRSFAGISGVNVHLAFSTFYCSSPTRTKSGENWVRDQAQSPEVFRKQG
jgi:hypothetical protein